MPVKVLIIDDNTSTTDILSTALETTDYQVLSANNSRKGIEIAKNEIPDLILIDLVMSEKGSWKVCNSIRNFSQAPILMLSVVNKPGMVAKALDEGADDYLIKPVPNNLLVARINTLIRRARAEQNAALASNGY